MTNKKTYYRAEVIDGVPTIKPVEMSYRAASSRKRKKGVQIFDDEKGAALWLVEITYKAQSLANELLYQVAKASQLKKPPAE